MEPQVKIQIPNLIDEKKHFRQLGIMQKPKAMYLNYCNKYAELHLIKHKHYIRDYKFKKEDVENESFSRDVLRWVKQLSTDGEDPMSLSNEEFASLFKTETIKLFIDYIIHDQEAYIIVKSWQKVSFLLRDEEEEKNRNNSRLINRQQSTSNMPVLDKQIQNTAMFSQQNQSQAKNTFYIKTLDVLNKVGESLSKDGPILVE